MKVDEMPAGREMDALVWVKVFGCSEPIWQDGEPIFPATRSVTLPHFSTDIAAAWEVVEKLSENNYFVNVCRFPRDIRANVHVQKVLDYNGNLDSPIQLQGGSAPLAICRAALKAMGVEEA